MEIGSIIEIDVRDLFNKSLKEEIRFPFMGVDDYNVDFYNTGRAAIEVLLTTLKQQGKTRVWLPAFNCSSVYESALRVGMDVKLYPVNRDLSIPCSFIREVGVESTDIFYVVQFFGSVLTNEFMNMVDTLKRESVCIVEDLTLAIFSVKSGFFGFGDYIIGSIRKWLPIPDGGFIASKLDLPVRSTMGAGYDYSLYYLMAQLMKTEYLKDNTLDKQVFLDISNEGMKALFSDYTIREMSSISRRVLLSFDFDAVAKKRNDNYDELYNLLSGIQGVNLLVRRYEGMCPLGMIISVEEKRDELFRYLISNGVYCNIHWRPNDCTQSFEDAAYLAEHCITIPCDQRYGSEEMHYIYTLVSNFFK